MSDKIQETKEKSFHNSKTNGDIEHKTNDLDIDTTLVDVVQYSKEPPGYKCKLCGVFYPRKWPMKLHIRTHTGEKPYICDFIDCNKAFPRPGSLSEHKKRYHRKLLMNECPICDKKFYGRSDMLIHIVIHDEARQLRERFLPPQMLKLLSEVNELNFDGQLIVSNCVCGKCGKIFEKKGGKERHIKSVHLREYKCSISSCDKSFFAKSSLIIHTKEFHGSKTRKLESAENVNYMGDIKIEKNHVFKCSSSDCEKQFGTRVELENHIGTGNHDGRFFFSCSKCPQKFVSSLALKLHSKEPCESHAQTKDIKEEENVIIEVDGLDEYNSANTDMIESLNKELTKKLPYPCDVCENSLSSEENFRIHKLIHEELNRFKCSEKVCKEVFPHQKGLANHLKLIHQTVKIADNRIFHMCDDCGKHCSTKSGLEMHMVRHSKEKNFVCLECGKKLKRRQSLNLHMRSHSGEKTFQCDKCESNYFTSTALRNHTIAKHTDSKNEEFICSYCGKCFKKKYYLLNHISVHTGEKKFQCNFCEKKFRLEVSFTNHTNMHNGVKPFQCQHCEKRFTQRQQMRVHVRRHIGDKRHKCNSCEKAFVEPRCLRNHMKTHQL